MCGRYSVLDDVDELCFRFACPLPGFRLQPRYNAAPTQIMPVVTGGRQREMRQMRWGLIPRWAREGRMRNPLINARLETLNEKPAFKAALRYRRCLVPADGYYEWLPGKRGKIPYRVTVDSQKVFAMAGLWESWVGSEGNRVESFTIVTTDSVPAIAWLHDRMPLILPRHLEAAWIKGVEGNSPGSLRDWLGEMRPLDNLKTYPVSALVNSPKNDDSSILESVPEK